LFFLFDFDVCLEKREKEEKLNDELSLFSFERNEKNKNPIMLLSKLFFGR